MTRRLRRREEEDVEQAEEEEQEETSPPPPRKKKKLKKFLIIVTLVLLCTAGTAAYFVYLHAKQAKAAEAVQEETVLNPSQSTPVVKKTCLDPPEYYWIRDVVIPSSNAEKWRLHLYSGVVSYDDMKRICQRTDLDVRDGTSNALYINSGNEEKAIDTIVRDNHKDIFGTGTPFDKRFIWTGYVYHFVDGVWYNNFPKPVVFHLGFCESQWHSKLTRLQEASKEPIYVVKDFRGDNMGKNGAAACWQLYGKSELTTLLEQPKEATPRLHFVCASKVGKPRTGKEADPRFFQPKHTHGQFTFYGIKATLSEAVVTCQQDGGHLVTVDTVEKRNTLKSALDDTVNNKKIYFDSGNGLKFWTGGFFNTTTSNPNQLRWMRNPTVPTIPIETTTFCEGGYFDSIPNAKAEVQRAQRIDCDTTIVLRVQYKKEGNCLQWTKDEAMRKGTEQYYIICEK